MCDFCNEIKSYVYEHYEFSSGDTIEVMIHPVTKEIVGKHKFICKTCKEGIN